MLYLFLVAIGEKPRPAPSIQGADIVKDGTLPPFCVEEGVGVQRNKLPLSSQELLKYRCG